MTDYKPPFTITNEILSYTSSISEKIGNFMAISNMDAKPYLRRNNRIKSIHSSLKIEANSLSLGQVRDVIDGRTVLGEQKEIQEVKNAYNAYEHFSATLILKNYKECYACFNNPLSIWRRSG